MACRPDTVFLGIMLRCGRVLWKEDAVAWRAQSALHGFLVVLQAAGRRAGSQGVGMACIGEGGQASEEAPQPRRIGIDSIRPWLHTSSHALSHNVPAH